MNCGADYRTVTLNGKLDVITLARLQVNSLVNYSWKRIFTGAFQNVLHSIFSLKKKAYLTYKREVKPAMMQCISLFTIRENKIIVSSIDELTNSHLAKEHFYSYNQKKYL